MGVLNIDADTFEVRLGDLVNRVDIIIGIDDKEMVDNYHRIFAYRDTKKAELIERIKDLRCAVPRGSDIRKCIQEVLGIYVNTRSEGKLCFGKGTTLAKYYKCFSPKDLDPCDREFCTFKIKSTDGITYTGISVSLVYNQKAPYDDYMF